MMPRIKIERCVLAGLVCACFACTGNAMFDTAAPNAGAAGAVSVMAPVSQPGASSSTATVTPNVSNAMTNPTSSAGTGAPNVPMMSDNSNTQAASPVTNTTALPSTGAVTYHRDIRPIIEARCIGCHTKDGAGGFALDSWAAVDQVKSAIIPVVKTRRMPPWTADDTSCTKLRNSQRLTDAQLKLFSDWQAGGFAQGEPSEFVALAEPPKAVLGEPTLIVKPTPATLRAGDEWYACQQTDGNFTEDTWITALDVVPEHTEYVHHAIVSVGGGSCSALGTTAENIYSFRPGSRTVVFDPGDAMLLRAGSTIAIQYHFNTKFAPAGMTLPTDQSPLRLWTLPKGQRPERAVVRMAHHNFSINIPVNAVDQKVSATSAIGSEYTQPGAEIIGMSPHMHYLGQTFRETLIGRDGTSTCLIDIPDWEQDWQLDYMFEPSAYIEVSSGARVSQDCVYSNRTEDQGVGPDGKPFTPQHTTFGEDTRQEMCLGYIWFRYPLGGAR